MLSRHTVLPREDAGEYALVQKIHCDQTGCHRNRNEECQKIRDHDAFSLALASVQIHLLRENEAKEKAPEKMCRWSHNVCFADGVGRNAAPARGI